MGFYEIAGQSCVGKTSFVSSYVESNKNYIVYKRNTFNFFTDFISGLRYLRSKRTRKIFIWSFNEDASLLFKFNIFRNAVTKFGIFLKLTSFYGSDKNVYFVDEGISHLPFIFLNTSTNEVIDFISNELRFLRIKYLVCMEPSYVESRLLNRGHKRLKFLDSTYFVSRNFEIQSILIKIYPKLCRSFIEIENVRNTE